MEPMESKLNTNSNDNAAKMDSNTENLINLNNQDSKVFEQKVTIIIICEKGTIF